jgi:choline dehydrogenase-like flavoprotein
MFLDTRRIDADELSTDVCVIGGGAAGIALALELSSHSVDVILLESGGHQSDSETQSLYEGENVGHNYERLDQARSRWLGGSTNCWGGWCRPLDPLDFEHRPWMPNSGWPLKYADLEPWYLRSIPMLRLHKPGYSANDWRSELPRNGGKLFPLDETVITNVINQFSPPARFGRLYRRELAGAPRLKVLLYANVTQIHADPASNRVDSVRAETFTGRQIKVGAKAYVLATGGIENARLLLASNAVEPRGVGNRNGLVGRYFMDHPRVAGHAVRLSDHRSHRVLYDKTSAKVRQIVGGARGRVTVHVAPTAATQVSRSLPNSRTYLSADHSFEKTAAYASVKDLRRRWNARKQGERWPPEWARTTLAELPQLAQLPGEMVGLVDAWLNLGLSPRRFELVTIIEPTPNRESRVTLSPSCDRLSQPRAMVNWQLTEADRRSFEVINDLALTELERQGVVTGADGVARDFWSTNLVGCWHHMGTTRMAESPSEGVVDANCRLHDYANAYVTGSSVFPTCGSDMPTLTVVALALRLSAHLREALSARKL